MGYAGEQRQKKKRVSCAQGPRRHVSCGRAGQAGFVKVTVGWGPIVGSRVDAMIAVTTVVAVWWQRGMGLGKRAQVSDRCRLFSGWQWQWAGTGTRGWEDNRCCAIGDWTMDDDGEGWLKSDDLLLSMLLSLSRKDGCGAGDCDYHGFAYWIACDKEISKGDWSSLAGIVHMRLEIAAVEVRERRQITPAINNHHSTVLRYLLPHYPKIKANGVSSAPSRPTDSARFGLRK